MADNLFAARPGDNLFTQAANAKAPTQPAFTNFNVKPAATVSGQINTLLAQDSPYLKEARARSQRQANSRGLINSSIAAGAGESAAINAALPIAQQDAQANFSADQFNAQGQNEFATDYANFQQQAYLQGRDAAFGNAAAENQFGRTLDLQNDTQAFSADQAKLDRGQQLTLQGNEFGFQREQSGLDRNQQLTLQGNDQKFQGAQSALNRGQELEVLNRQQSFTGGQNNLDRALQTNLQGNELKFSREQLAQQANEAKLDRAFQSTIQDDQQSFLSTQAGLDRTLQSDSLTKEINAQNSRLTQELQNRTQLAADERALSRSLLSTQITGQQDLARLNQQLSQITTKFESELNDKARLLDLTRGRNVSLQQSVATLSGQMLSDISQIFASEIPGDAKPGIVKSIQQQYQAVYDLLESIESSAILSKGQGGF